MGAGVEPGESATEDLNFQLAALEEFLIDCRDFQLPSCTGFDVLGNVYDFVGIEIETDDGIVALGFLGFFLDAKAVPLFVEFGNAVTLGVADPITEDGGFIVLLRIFYSLLKQAGEATTVENVVAKDKTCAIIPDEFLADDKSLGETVRTGLLGVFEMNAVIGSITKKAFEAREVIGRRDDQDIPNPCQHQCADGVIDHRLVINGQQLLADAFGNWVKSCAGSSGEYDAFHIRTIFLKH